MAFHLLPMTQLSRRMIACGLLAALAFAGSAGRWALADASANDLAPAKQFETAEPLEALSGGIGTSVEALDEKAFAHALFGLPVDRRIDFERGKILFRKNWLPAPSSMTSDDGLGPLYNARSCQACHGEDARGRPFFADRPGDGITVRLSAGPQADPDPVYGQQIQDKAIAGQMAEAHVSVAWRELPVTFDDGTTVTLREPVFSLEDLAYGPLDPATGMSVRLAQPLVGLGLIEAIPDQSILAHADPDDRNGDGISGRPEVARTARGEMRVGRFGWKSAQADLIGQTAHALVIDMGLSNPLLPQPQGDCTAGQADCLAQPDGRDGNGGEEVGMEALGQLAFYVRSLAVPARRQAADKTVLAGKRAFYEAGCAACHVPKFRTADDASLKPLASQLIWPYSDFLLHDMGEALGDGSGTEWRTPPLWGIGLTRIVAGEEFYLHDGRARTLEEAILWHGGEGEAARDAYLAMASADRQALVRFLESL